MGSVGGGRRLHRKHCRPTAIPSPVKHMCARELKEISSPASAYPGVTFHGHVTAIAPATQSFFSLIPTSATAGTYIQTVQRVPVNIQIHTDGHTLLPGESMSVTFHT